MFGHQDEDIDNSNGADNQAPVNGSQQGPVAPLAGDYHSTMIPSTPLLTAVTDDQHDVEVPVSSPTSTDTSATPQQSTDLVSLKVQALGELYPLVHQLNLSPEENFRTIMMMIQATDNKDLLQSAYEAANKIEDEHAKAKALLDVVNEINYFTNQPGSN